MATVLHIQTPRLCVIIVWIMTNEETKDEILNAADALFNKSGIRATTIDDVCRAVGISKKTFYQFYLNKEELVASVSKYHLDQKFAQFKELLEGKDVVQILKIWVEFVDKKKFFESDRRLGEELQKYYPKTHENNVKDKSRIVKDVLERYLGIGIEQGYFRGDIDIEAVIILISLMHKGLTMYRNDDLVVGSGRKLSNKRLLAGFKYILVRSLLSEKGWAYYESIGQENTPPVER